MDRTDLKAFDDVLTDAFIDKLFLPFRTRKMTDIQVRAPNDTDTASSLLNIIKSKVIPGDLDGAVTEFYDLFPYVREFVPANARKSSLEEFFTHAKRYLAMYLPNAGFEIARTYQYNDIEGEACLLATREYVPKEAIPLCTGRLARISEEEEDSMRERNMDFSLMFSEYTKSVNILTGPLRLVNHDCDPNTKFISVSKGVVSLETVKAIRRGEEITVGYSPDYFQTNECLCASCHRAAESSPMPERKTDIKGADEGSQHNQNEPLSTPESRTHRRSARIKIRSPRGEAMAADPGPADEHRCTSCIELMANENGTCERCERHIKIFGCPWPERVAGDRLLEQRTVTRITKYTTERPPSNKRARDEDRKRGGKKALR